LISSAASNSERIAGNVERVTFRSRSGIQQSNIIPTDHKKAPGTPGLSVIGFGSP
jgi:hypothetical protein